MVAYRLWSDLPPRSFARFWYAMLHECNLLGSGPVDDWEERLTEQFRFGIEHDQMQWFVAEEDGRLVGTAVAILSLGGLWITKDLIATLAGIYVVPEFRKRGIGRELTQRAIAWCKERGCVSIRLRASDAGRPLYESLGFVPASEMRLDLRPGPLF